MRVAVIGAGPAGLVALKCLLEARKRFSFENLEVWLFEREDSVGGTFRYRTYEEGELVSSRFLTSFSDYRISDDSPDFVSTVAYCAYLDGYCTHFNLWPRIRLRTTVHSVKRNDQGGHTVTFSEDGSDEQETWDCDALAVCSGLNVTPNLPDVSGIEHVPEAFHSSVFKERKQFGVDRNVMILGAGETAMDIARLAVTSPTNSVTLCHRGGWKNEPKKLPDPVYLKNARAREDDIQRNGVSPPTDTGYASLFDTAYIHPALELSRWPWEYYDKFTWFYAWLTTGAGTGIDQFAGEIRGERHHARRAVANKSNMAMVYISDPYRPTVKSPIERLRTFFIDLPRQEIGGRVIDLAPWPSHIDEQGVVHFRDNGRPEYEVMKKTKYKPDLVVYATGYTQLFPFLDESYPTIFDADIRRIWKSGMEDVAFFGFTRPAFGAIPPLAELQVQLWITNLLQGLPRPLCPKENYLLQPDPDRRLDYIVDHETYAYCLAKDMGAAPSILQVLSFGPIVFLTWALGPNFNTKFRLVGPWKWDGAAEIMQGELWRVIRRRKGFIIWTCMTVAPLIIFGTLSLLYLLVHGLSDATYGLLGVSYPENGEIGAKAIRGRDPSGVKKARAKQDALGSRKVGRKENM